MSESRVFHLGDILSVTTGYLFSPRRIKGLYDILNYMTGGNTPFPDLRSSIDECKPYLAEQFPQFNGDNLLLRASLSALRSKFHLSDIGYIPESRTTISERWLENQIKWYGEFHEVKPIPDVKTSSRDS